MLFSKAELQIGRIKHKDGREQSGVKHYFRSRLRQLESDPDRGFAYPSITFVGDEVLFTYYRTKWAGDGVMGGLGWELKLQIRPLSWLYAAEGASPRL